MANDDKPKSKGLSNAVTAMIVCAIAGAIIVGLSFQVIVYWPQPVAVAPYFEDSLFPTGAMWGLIVGGFVGWIIGWLTDESHFGDSTY